MRWCLDEDDVSALHDATTLWNPDSVRFSPLALAAPLPFRSRSVEVSGVLDVHEGSGSDNANVREVGFLAVKHLQYRLHLERLTRIPVFEVRSRHKQPPPHGRWKAPGCEHAPNHGA